MITYSGEMNPFKPGVERILEDSPVQVIPMALRGLWGDSTRLVPYPTDPDQQQRPLPYYDASGIRLPDVLDDNAVYGGSTSDLNGLVKSGKSLAEGGDRMAMIADIKAALLRLTVDERELLLRKYGPDATDDLLVQWYEATLDAMNKRVLRVVRKVAKHLGSEPVRRRKSISNAQAQHITREQE